jgi:hypothetical protein
MHYAVCQIFIPFLEINTSKKNESAVFQIFNSFLEIDTYFQKG